MKAKSILAALLLLVAGLQTAWGQKVLLYKTNSQVVEYEVSELDSIVFVEAEAKLVQQIVLSETSLTLQPNEMRFLTATVLPENAQNKVVTWQSSDTNVAEVNQSGRVIANANGTCVITCRATDGSDVKATCQVTVAVDNSGTINGREYVDLGLPSGTKWATCNVGASKPEEYGDYFAWGETTPKSTYDWSTYRWCNGSSITMTKYCTQSDYGYNGFTDNLTELQPEDDAATANWGSGWRMPSYGQFSELFNSSYTTSEWTTLNGVYGYKVTSKSNGNSIFLPAAGYRWNDELIYAGSYGYYWSSSLDPNYGSGAYYLDFRSGGWGWSSNIRSNGLSVRAELTSSTFGSEFKCILPRSTIQAKNHSSSFSIQPRARTGKNSVPSRHAPRLRTRLERK